MRPTIASFALLCAAGLALAADKDPTTSPPLKATDFLPQAMAQAMALERFSSLVEKRSEHKSVKELAARLTEDGKACWKGLEKLAAGEKVGFLTGLEKNHQLRLGELTLLSGDKFDRAYVAQVVADLEQLDKLMAKQAEGGTKALQDHAKEHGAMWKKDLEAARKVQKEVGLPEAK